MTMKEKKDTLAIYAWAITELEEKIAVTEADIEYYCARVAELNNHIDKLNRRLKRQQGKLRRMEANKEYIANEIDEYDEFYLLAVNMTA